MFGRYIFVGIGNTLLTLSIIYFLMWININLYVANFIGYSIGISLSFLLNSKFTFSSTMSIRKFAKFLVSCSICYILNIFVIYVTILWSIQSDYIAQFLGMIVYTILGFLLNKLWVMKNA